MADDFWSGLGGLLGSGNADLYGDLLTDKQRQALLFKEIGGGLDEISRRAAEAGKPSLMPGGKGWLGSALSGYGAGANAAGEGMLKTLGDAQKIRAMRRQQKLLEELDPIQRELLRRQLAQTGGGLPGAPPAGIPAAPPGMPAAPLTPTAPPGAVPQGPPASGYSGPTNAELGAPPLAAAPGGATTGLPARIGMKGTGPNAVMIDLDTGQPIQSSPGGPITQPGQVPYVQPSPPPSPLKQSGLLSEPGGLDQLVGEDGQPLTGGGLLPNILASYTGGQAGATLPFQLASATPTSGTTPGAAGASRDDPRGVVPYIRERAAALGIDPDVAERVARSEGVGTFQSSVIQKSGRREPSWGAFQLYTGGGMGNDFQRDTGLDPSDPKNEKATIDYALQKARTGGWTPWHGAKGAGISARAGIPGGEDYVIPSGRGIPASALTTVADTAPRPGTPTASGGVIPGLGITPEALATLNSMYKAAGVDAPFGSLLETYYKSPAYLEEKTRTETKARTDVEDPLNRRMKVLEFNLKMRGDGFIVGDDGQVTEDPQWAKIHERRTDETEGLKAKYQKQIKTFEEQITIDQEKRADQREIVQAPVYGPDGQVVLKEMPRGEKVKRLQDQTMRPNEYQPGDIVAKPVGDPPADHQWRMTPQGALKAVPVPGTPGAEKAAELTRTQQMADRTMLRARDIMNEDTAEIERTMKSSLLPVTGFWGQLLSSSSGTPQHDVAVKIAAIKARTSLDSINATRAATGSTGLGQITMGEHGMLASAIAALEQSQTKEAFLSALHRVNAEYNNLISSPAFRGTMPATTVVVPPAAPARAPPATTGAPRTGRYNPATGRVEYQ